jgi:glycosyltransferase involved in cell wall biosynthesis
MALEFCDIDQDYNWSVADQKHHAGVISLSKRNDRRNCQRAILKLSEKLKEFSPDAVAIPGYSEPFALSTACICRKLGIPAVLMSDSHSLGRPRNRVRETFKRQILPLFQAGFVAGTPHREYLVGLGFPKHKITTGYDVVDNQHFANVQDSRMPGCTSRQLPENYFFCCSRLVEGKNLFFLIDAFKRYRISSVRNAWDLVIAGEGPLLSEITCRVQRSALAKSVHIIGRKTYHDLPALYASARAFVFPSFAETWGLVVNEAMASGLPVLVSSGVGCHLDLVRQGINGYVFDPGNEIELANLLVRMTNAQNCSAMGEASRSIIRDWDLDRFASGLIEAATIATTSRRLKRIVATAILATALSYRV